VSFLSYNGFEMDLLRTNSYTKEAVFTDDQSDYLYTRFRIDADCVWNPEATSYDANLEATPGVLPASTEANIRMALMQPRRKLFFSVEHPDPEGEAPNDILIESPAGGRPNDATNGPHVTRCTVKQIAGSRTFLVNIVVETCLLECETAPLISNRWSQAHEIDDNFYTTITTTGLAQFRMDAKPGVAIDRFRADALPAIPRGFRRLGTKVVINPLGNMLAYTCIDREMPYSLGPTLVQGNSGVTKFASRLVANTLQQEKSYAASSTVSLTFECQVEGSKLTPRKNLIVFAARLAVNKLQIPIGPVDQNLGPIVRRVMVAEHLHEKAITFAMEVIIAPNQGGQPALGFGPIPLDRWLGLEFGGQPAADPALFAFDGTNPQPPFDSNTRGTWPGLAVAAALRDACTPAPALDEIDCQIGDASDNYFDVDCTPPVSIWVQADPPTTSSSYSSSWHTDYKVDTSYSKNYQTMAGPVTGASTGGGSSGEDWPETEFMVLAAPTATKIVSWTAERFGRPPILPLPEPSDPNLVLLRTEVIPAAPELMPDANSYVYRVSGIYLYGMRRARGAGDSLPMGALPWTTLRFSESFLRESDYQSGIIDDGTGGGSFPSPRP
jgi:hypothetical protein